MTDLNKLLAQKQIERKGKPDLSLPTENPDSILNTVKEISLTAINEDINQPRKDFNPEKITALAESIKEKGLIQPIIVKQSGKGYLIVAGHRRYKAFKQLGKETIPCIIRDEVLSEVDLTEIALIENLQRDDLNTLEVAESIYHLKKIRDIKQREIAVITGYSEGNISKYIQLFEIVKDDDKKKQRVITVGFKRAYLHFCTESERKEKEKKKARGQTLLVEIKDNASRQEIEQAIKKTENFLAYLQGKLKEVSR